MFACTYHLVQRSPVFCMTVHNEEESIIHFKDLVARINRPEMRFHDIRHTYATLSIQSDVDFKTLSLSMGHATVAFTLETYGHVSNRMSQNAADKMEKLICSL